MELTITTIKLSQLHGEESTDAPNYCDAKLHGFCLTVHTGIGLYHDVPSNQYWLNAYFYMCMVFSPLFAVPSPQPLE
jgi:hypothetical protein